MNRIAAVPALLLLPLVLPVWAAQDRNAGSGGGPAADRPSSVRSSEDPLPGPDGDESEGTASQGGDQGTAFCKGKSFAVPAGETLIGDRYFLGKEVRIDGTLQGDLFAAGDVASIKGTVTGDVNAAGNKVRVAGTVGDAVRACAGDVDVTGHVHGDVLAMGQNVNIESGSVVEGRVLVGGGRVQLGGQFKGPVQAGAGEIQFSGTAEGNVVLKADAIEFDPGARILGNLSYTAREEMEMFKNGSEAGKKIVSGKVTFVPKSKKEKKRGFFGGFAFNLWSFVAAYIVGSLFIALARGPVTTIIRAGQEDWLKSVGYGVLGHVFAPFAGLVLIGLCLTIPAGVLVLMGWAMLFYVGKLVGALIIADWLLRKIGFRASPYLSLFLGMIPLWILWQIPYLGFFSYLFIIPIFGIGATLVGLHDHLKARRESAPPHDVVPAQALA